VSTRPATTARVSTFAPLRVRAFRRLFIAGTISEGGSFLLLAAAPWLMLELTRSPLMVSLVTVSLALPRLLLTLPAGALADAIDRRLLFMVGQWGAALAAAILAVLTWQDGVTPGTLLVLCFALGVGIAVSTPAQQSLIPDLVDRELVPAASSLNSASFNIARAVGPAIGGALSAAGKADLAFGLDAVSFLAVVAVLVGMPAVGQADGGGGGMWRSTRTGLRYVRFTRPLLLLVGTAAAFTLTGTAIQTLLPNVVSDDLRLGADGFGLLLGTFGLGALVGALTRERARTFIRGLLPLSMGGFGVAGLVFGLSRLPLLSAVALAIAGLFWVWTLTTMHATVQLMSPRWVRGRATSIYLLAVLGVQPFGAVIAGSLAEVIGAATTVAVLTVATVLVGFVAGRADLPILGEVIAPQALDDWSVPRHEPQVAGSPVLVATTWRIDPADAPEFFAALRTLRRHRLRTGADRWTVFRHADDPCLITEQFQVHDWEEHLAQHARIDDEVAAALRHARSFDRAGGPATQHLAGLDLLDPASLFVQETAVARHAALHARDGSVPLEVSGRDPGSPHHPRPPAPTAAPGA
jgi:MFS family permease